MLVTKQHKTNGLNFCFKF